MYLLYVVLAACICLVKTQSTISAEDEETTVALEADDIENLIEQSVALIDIVFTNNKKRTCTGAIIHDYVVITAGHCFLGSIDGPENVPPELTASFVVIGTKNKFEAGYEQYLPIERVVTHPNMKSWRSDLALIHTFASMTANKIGAVIPLANDKSYGPGDGNFTVLSWGRTMGGHESEETVKEESNSCEDDYNNKRESSESNRERFVGHSEFGKPKAYDSTAPIPIVREGKVILQDSKNEHLRKIQQNYPTTKRVSRYLFSNENRNQQRQPVAPPRHRYHKIHRNQTAVSKEDSVNPINVAQGSRIHKRLEDDTKDDTRRTKENENGIVQADKEEIKQRAHAAKRTRSSKKRMKTNWGTSWRRQMGTKEANKLTVESFGYIGSQPCKKMVNKIIPDMHLNSSEVVCYASDDHYVTEEDSGAPAIRQGELVAITLGGIVSEGDHVAVGIKLSEFCAWMSENLPAGTETSLNCWSGHGGSSDMHESDETEKEKAPMKSSRNRYLG